VGERSAEKPTARDLDAGDLRIAVVVSRYNLDISRRLLAGALEALERMSATDPDVVWVPGALELPVAALTLAEGGQADAIVALGCVVNGETAHFQYVAGECAAGLMHVQMDTGVPVAFLTTTWSGCASTRPSRSATWCSRTPTRCGCWERVRSAPT